MRSQHHCWTEPFVGHGRRASSCEALNGADGSELVFKRRAAGGRLLKECAAAVSAGRRNRDSSRNSIRRSPATVGNCLDEVHPETHGAPSSRPLISKENKQALRSKGPGRTQGGARREEEEGTGNVRQAAASESRDVRRMR